MATDLWGLVRKATCRVGSLFHCTDRSRSKELNDLFPAHTGGKSSGWRRVALVKSLYPVPWCKKGNAGEEG